MESLQLVAECPICQTLDHRPKILSCGHTVCLNCIKDLIEQKPKEVSIKPAESSHDDCMTAEDLNGPLEDEIECPTCLTKIKLTIAEANQLPTNYVALQLRDSMTNLHTKQIGLQTGVEERLRMLPQLEEQLQSIKCMVDKIDDAHMSLLSPNDNNDYFHANKQIQCGKTTMDCQTDKTETCIWVAGAVIVCFAAIMICQVCFTAIECMAMPVKNMHFSSPKAASGAYITVICSRGYRLLGSNRLRCTSSGAFSSTDQPYCEGINHCDSSPCINGGVCKKEDNSYSCVCTEDYRGTNCEIDQYITQDSTD